MSTHSEWLRSRQQLLAQIKRQVLQKLGPEVPELLYYRHRYRADFARPWRFSSMEKLRKEIINANVVIGADFHAFAQSQRMHLRLLREVSAKKKVALVLEALPCDKQKYFNDYVAGKISEKKFLKQVSWDENWGFPWENYKPLLDLIKENGGVIYGLRQPHVNSLKKRDEMAGKIIAGIHKTHPGLLIYVVVGDFHLAPNHLPKSILRNFSAAKKPRVIRLLQNSEELYFRVARRKRQHQVEVLRASADSYCILSSPPWVQWQSYLMYLEQAVDSDMSSGEVDYTDGVASFVSFLARELRIDVRLDRMQVYTIEQFEKSAQLKKIGKRSVYRFIDLMISAERSFLLPRAQVLLLARASVNHAAFLAGQYIHGQKCGLNRELANFPKDFLAHIWHEAVGFFCSKLINHKRKTEQLEDIKQQLRLMRPRGRDRAVLKLVLWQRLCELSKSQPRQPSSVRQQNIYLDAAHILGSMLGERMYQAWQEQVISVADIASALQVKLTDANFRKFYYQWVRKIDHQY